MRNDRLKELRINKGWSQDIAAEEFGVSRTTYAGYEQGYRKPDTDMLNKIADKFNVTSDFLLGRVDHPHMIKDDNDNETFDVYADPEGWIELLAAEYQEKNGRPLEDWKKKAILELLETNKQK